MRPSQALVAPDPIKPLGVVDGRVSRADRYEKVEAALWMVGQKIVGANRGEEMGGGSSCRPGALRGVLRKAFAEVGIKAVGFDKSGPPLARPPDWGFGLNVAQELAHGVLLGSLELSPIAMSRAFLEGRKVKRSGMLERLVEGRAEHRSSKGIRPTGVNRFTRIPVDEEGRGIEPTAPQTLGQGRDRAGKSRRGRPERAFKNAAPASGIRYHAALTQFALQMASSTSSGERVPSTTIKTLAQCLCEDEVAVAHLAVKLDVLSSCIRREGRSRGVTWIRSKPSSSAGMSPPPPPPR